MTLVDIDKIEMGQRFRSDLGDLQPLIDSIEEVGLIHPVVITDSFELVAGQRRIEALRKLGHEQVECRVLPLSPAEMLRAEHDENEVRKAFTPTERVAIARRLEAEVARQAKERQAHGQTAPGRNASETVTEAPTREIVGKAVGWSGPTYQRAKAVVAAAEEDPDRFGDLAEQMDKTGNVAGTFKEVQERKGATRPKPVSPPKPRLMPIAPGGQIVQNVTNSLHAAVTALDKINIDGATREEVAGWIGDLEDPLRQIRKTIRTWKERV